MGCPEDILVPRLYIPGNARKGANLRAHCSYHHPSEVTKKKLEEDFLCLPWRVGFGDVGTVSSYFHSNTNREALGTLLMCSNHLHITLLAPNLETSEVLDFPNFTPQTPESDNLSPA